MEEIPSWEANSSQLLQKLCVFYGTQKVHYHIHVSNTWLYRVSDSVINITNQVSLCNAHKEIDLEVNVEKTKYMVMSRDQNAGKNHNIKLDNKSFERVEQFKYLGTTLTYRNSIQEEI
jgi:hypothetical protein